MPYTRTYKDTVHIPYFASKDGVPTPIDRSKIWSVTGSRTGDRVDNWKEKIARGENATSEYTLSRTFLQKTRDGTSTLLRTDTNGKNPVEERFSGNIFADIITGIDTPAHLASLTGEAEAIALTKTYKKLQSELSRLNSPAVLAEFTSVLRQFGKPADALIDLTNRHLNRLELARRGLKGSTSFRRIKWHEIVASTYLEWSFGLKPLISDTEAVAEAFARFKQEAEGESPKLRAKIACRGLVATATQTYRPPYNVQSSYIRFNPVTTTKTETRCQYVCGLQGSFQADFGSNERLLQLLGFDHGNWIPAAWEFIPWSWLFDYFLNIGNILEAGVTSTARVAWISKTVSQSTDTKYQGLPIAPNVPAFFKLVGVENSKNAGGLIHTVRKTVTRTSPQSLGVPPLYYKHPFGSPAKLANMVAVLFARRPSASALWIS